VSEPEGGISIERATAAQMPLLREMFEEYRASAQADICFDAFAEELAQLPAGYDVIFIAMAATGEAAGCVALREVAPQTLDAPATELKRLYVRPRFRQKGLARRLMNAALTEATQAGYRRMVLDTLPHMVAAVDLYQAMGFRTTSRYNDNPAPQALFFELLLR
jgi:putative acetyltransferase